MATTRRIDELTPKAVPAGTDLFELQEPGGNSFNTSLSAMWLAGAPMANDGDILRWQTNAWVVSSDLTDHIADQTIHYPDAPADGSVYGRLNNAWAEIGDSGGDTLESLADTNITAPAANQYLRWDGNFWINAGIDAAHVVSGAFADARIAESNVTQHEAALTIFEGQIADLGNYAPLASPAFTGTVQTSGNFQAADGSAANPAYRFGAGGIGLYRSGVDSLVLAVGGVDILTVSPAGIAVAGAITATGDVTGFLGQ